MEIRTQLARIDADRELRLPATVLVGDKPQLYSDVDRLRAEGDLRVTVALPLTALFVTLAVIQSWWWVLGLIGVALLLRQGLIALDQSRRIVADAIANKRVDSAGQAEYESWAERFESDTLPQLIERQSARFVVLSATWQGQQEALDVTERLSSLVSNDSLNFTATNAVLGGDPEVNVGKTLTIRYQLDGTIRTAAFREKDEVQLPLMVSAS